MESVIQPREGWIKSSRLHVQDNIKKVEENEYVIPANLKYPLLFNDFLKDNKVKKFIDNERYIPIGMRVQSGDLVCLDASRLFCVGISGKSGTGKTNILKVLLSLLQMRNDNCYAIELDENKTEFKNIVYAENYLNSYEMIYSFFEALAPQIKERNLFVLECRDKKYTDTRIYDEMNGKFPKIHIFIADLVEFVNIVYEKNTILKFRQI